MSKLYVARRTNRVGLFIPMGGTEEKPNLMFFLPRMSDGQLDQYVRSELEKQGITDEATVTALVDQANKDHETRVKIKETEKEMRRLMAIKKEGGTKRLMQSGRRKWKETWYPGRELHE